VLGDLRSICILFLLSSYFPFFFLSFVSLLFCHSFTIPLHHTLPSKKERKRENIDIEKATAKEIGRGEGKR